MMEIDKFRLFSTCIPVKGYLRSIIYDVERNKYDFIPNLLYYLLIERDLGKKKDILESIPETLQNEYFTFLKGKDYILPVDINDKGLSEFNLTWDSPSKITNALLYIDKSSNYLDKELFKDFFFKWM